MNNSVRSLYFIRVRTIQPLDISKRYEFHSLKPRSSRLIRISSSHLRLGLQSGLFRQGRSATDYKTIYFKVLPQHSSGETDETHKKVSPMFPDDVKTGYLSNTSWKSHHCFRLLLENYYIYFLIPYKIIYILRLPSSGM